MLFSHREAGVSHLNTSVGIMKSHPVLVTLFCAVHKYVCVASYVRHTGVLLDGRVFYSILQKWHLP